MSLKKSIKKSIATFMAFSLISSNSYLCGIGITEVIAQEAKEPNIVMSVENSKYVQHTSEEYSSVAVQTKIQIGIEQEETQLAISKTEVAINLPALNGYLPERASVVDCDALLSMGKENNKQINQKYDSASGLLNVSYENEEAYSGYSKETKDEFEIIYIYPAEAALESEEEIELEYKLDTTMNFVVEESEVVSQKTESFKLQEKENKGNLVNFGVTELKDKIYKGFIYSNVENGTNYDTEYKTVSTFCVLDSKANTEILLEAKESKFITNKEEDNEISTNGLVRYIATGVRKDEFDTILGQDGYIEFYNDETIATIRYIEDGDSKKLAVIYADGEVSLLGDNETGLIVEYPADITSLKIKTSAPIAEGYIHFENQNVIKAADDYGEKIDNLVGIKLNSLANGLETTTNLVVLEPETKVTVTSSNVNFSTLQESKTTLTVKLDDTNSSVKLFKNPIIKIKLPDGLVEGNLSSPEIVNGNGLSIKTASATDNVITIELEGKQTTYDLTNVSGGTSIVMDIENIKFDDTIPTHEDKIEVTCIQGKEETKVEQIVNIVSKSGLLMLSKLSNFDQNNTVVTTIDNEIKTVEIENNSKEREALQTLNLINNYEDKITSVKVIGRIGYSNEDMQSTFDTELTKPIEVNGKVYYSTDKNASYDDESWTEEFSKDARAYKVEIDNKELASKGSIQIKLALKIPANLDYNQETYIRTEASYIYNEENMNDGSVTKMVTTVNKLVSNNTISNEKVTSLEGESVPVSLSIVPNITQNYVHSGQLIVYKVRVTNNGTEDLSNIVLTDIIPENAIYTYNQIKQDGMMTEYYELTKDNSIKQKEWKIEQLKAGETTEFEIMLTMADVAEEQTITNTVNLVVNEQTVAAESQIVLRPADISVNLTTSSEDVIGIVYDAGEELKYYINIRNTSGEQLKNIKVQYELPDTLEYVKGGLASYNEFDGYTIEEEGTFNNNVFEYNIEKLNENQEKVICITAKVKQLNNKKEANIDTIAKVELNGEIYESNVKTITTKQSAFEINLAVDTNGKTTLKKDDLVVYTIKAKNVGELTKIINIKDNIPEQLEVTKIEKDVNGENKYSIDTSTQDIEIVEALDKNDELTITITTKVKLIEVTESTILETINKATLSSGELELTSNEVIVNIEPEVKVIEENNEEDNFEPEDGKQDNNQEEDNNSSNEDNNVNNDNNQEENNNVNIEQEEKCTISGIAWIDSNKNGKRDENEKLQDSVIVSLVDMSVGNFALDSNGNRITTVTDDQGNYTFNNISKGTYIVLFEFDNNTYTVTTYQKEEIEDNLNSDVILSTVTIDGQKKLAALTDRMEIASNKENIDIGLMENATFDLSLNKQITKITVIDSQGTEEYQYENGDTAKVDLVAKYMNGANVVVNYKFTITNEGDVTGYVNSLVDNLPSGLEFSSELNNDWYKGSDGSLYTTSLSGVAIKPGESASVELVLTKTMTEENAGIFPNSAKLEKISNLENMQEDAEHIENNESAANLIISIKTGSIAMYAGITTICLAIICIGIYLIKKKVLNRGI